MSDFDPFAPLLEEDAFDHNLNFRVLRLASSLQTILQRSKLREMGVSAQEYRMMVSIARHGAGHVRDLSRKSSMDPAHASRTLKAMHSKGWLDRSPNANDKRLAIFSLTEDGRAMFMSIYPIADALAKDFASLFSEEDALKFRDMLDMARAHAAALLKD